MSTLAIVPARAGSKGIPGKNVRPLGGHPLVAWSIAAARLVAAIDRVIVSTDSEELASVARQYGADVPFLRPAELAADLSPDRDFLVHALSWLRAHEGAVPDLLVHLRPTTPLRSPEVVQSAIAAMREHPEATSLRSAHRASESPLKWFRRDASPYFQPLVALPSLCDVNAPRQVFETAFVPNGYVDVLRTTQIESGADIHGEHILALETARSAEVDTVEDLEYLEFQLGREPSALREWLAGRGGRADG